MDILIRYSTWLTTTALMIITFVLSWQDSLFFSPLFFVFFIGFFIGVVDLLQAKHTLRRNYPLVAHIRWMLEDLRPYLRQYIVEGNHSERPYPRDKRALIYARGKGDEDYHPFGTELDVDKSGYEWLAQSMTPAKIDIKKDLRVTVGNGQCQQPYDASLYNISAMSFGSLSARAVEALNLGAYRGNFYHDTGEGAISDYHTKHGGDLVWELGTGYFGCRRSDGQFDPELFSKKRRLTKLK